MIGRIFEWKGRGSGVTLAFARSMCVCVVFVGCERVRVFSNVLCSLKWRMRLWCGSSRWSDNNVDYSIWSSLCCVCVGDLGVGDCGRNDDRLRVKPGRDSDKTTSRTHSINRTPRRPYYARPFDPRREDAFDLLSSQIGTHLHHHRKHWCLICQTRDIARIPQLYIYVEGWIFVNSKSMI